MRPIRILMAFLHCLLVSTIIVDKTGGILILLLLLNVDLKGIIIRSFKIFSYPCCSRMFKWFALFGFPPPPPTPVLTMIDFLGPIPFHLKLTPFGSGKFLYISSFFHHPPFVFVFWIIGGCWTSWLISYHIFSLISHLCPFLFSPICSRFPWLYRPTLTEIFILAIIFLISMSSALLFDWILFPRFDFVFFLMDAIAFLFYRNIWTFQCFLLSSSLSLNNLRSFSLYTGIPCFLKVCFIPLAFMKELH